MKNKDLTGSLWVNESFQENWEYTVHEDEKDIKFDINGLILNWT